MPSDRVAVRLDARTPSGMSPVSTVLSGRYAFGRVPPVRGSERSVCLDDRPPPQFAPAGRRPEGNGHHPASEWLGSDRGHAKPWPRHPAAAPRSLAMFHCLLSVRTRSIRRQSTKSAPAPQCPREDLAGRIQSCGVERSTACHGSVTGPLKVSSVTLPGLRRVAPTAKEGTLASGSSYGPSPSALIKFVPGDEVLWVSEERAVAGVLGPWALAGWACVGVFGASGEIGVIKVEGTDFVFEEKNLAAARALLEGEVFIAQVAAAAAEDLVVVDG